jgi:hypothetical protein
MTARVNLPRFLVAHRTNVVCRGLAVLVGATLVVALLPGTVAAQHGQPSAVTRIPALAVLMAGKLTLVQDGSLTTVGPVRVGRAGKAMTVTDFEWSSGGRYLGWDQTDLTTGEGAIGWYDTVTHRRASWTVEQQYSEGLSVSSSGLALLVAGEDLNSPSTLITYKVGGPVSHRSVRVPTSDNVAGYSGGFIMGPDIKTGTQLWRVSVSGTVTKLKALPKPARNGPPYEVTAVSPDGKVFAAELGDHTDGCGVGPASRIFVFNTARGTVRAASLPTGPRWRVQQFVFDPTDTLDATMIDCTGQSTMRTAVLWVSSKGVLTGDENGALVATSAGGHLAYQAGHIKVGGTEAPILEEIASGPLSVNGKALAAMTAATTVSWAP